MIPNYYGGYNSFGGYNQPQYQQQYQPMQQLQNAQMATDERIWVASETAAEAYPMAANGFVRLWDSNQPVFYEKRADASGRPYPMTAYEYKLKAAPEPIQQPIPNDYEKRLSALEEQFKLLTTSNNAEKEA